MARWNVKMRSWDAFATLARFYHAGTQARWHVNHAGKQARWHVDNVGTQARMARNLTNSQTATISANVLFAFVMTHNCACSTSKSKQKM